MALTPDLEEAECFYRDVIGVALIDKTTNQLGFDLVGRARGQSVTEPTFTAVQPSQVRGTPS